MKMVSRITAIGLAGVAICYLGLSGYVWYHDNKRSKQADVQASAVSENNKVLGFLREKGCDYCHTPSAELPAYYYIPGAKQLMDYDIKLGYKSFNLEAVRAALLADKPVSQSDLNKIEWVMQYETMPPTRYTALHWAGKVSDEERAEILAWIAKQRAEYYASNDTAPEHRNEPVQPIPQKLPTDAQKVALGFALYHDPRLSADSTISCAHCHALNAGGVDGRKTSIGVGGAVGPINAPTVFNSVFNVEQFWDGRAATLQDQAGGPPLNPIEMASKSWDEIIAKLEKDPQLKAQFLGIGHVPQLTSSTPGIPGAVGALAAWNRRQHLGHPAPGGGLAHLQQLNLADLSRQGPLDKDRLSLQPGHPLSRAAVSFDPKRVLFVLFRRHGHVSFLVSMSFGNSIPQGIFLEQP